jgi:hypothetical protein
MKQSIYPVLRRGLLRFARNDEGRDREPMLQPLRANRRITSSSCSRLR